MYSCSSQSRSVLVLYPGIDWDVNTPLDGSRLEVFRREISLAHPSNHLTHLLHTGIGVLHQSLLFCMTAPAIRYLLTSWSTWQENDLICDLWCGPGANTARFLPVKAQFYLGPLSPPPHPPSLTLWPKTMQKCHRSKPYPRCLLLCRSRSI